MKWVIIAVIILVAVLLIIYLVGRMLPQQHTATMTESFSSSPGQVWVVISNASEFPTWRNDVKEVVKTSDNTFKEVTKGGDAVEYRVESSESNKGMITRIITPGLPYGGSWSYEIAALENGCTLTIIENGEVYSPAFRFMSKFIFGHDGTLKNYMKNLKKRIQ